MATERIDIIVSERGSQTVKRNIEDLAGASTRAGSATDQLKASLGAIRPTSQLAQVLSQLDSVRNAMRSNGASTAWAPVVQSQQAQSELSKVVAQLDTVRARMAQTGPSSAWFPRIAIRDAGAEAAKFSKNLDDLRAKLLVQGPVSAWPRGPILDANTELGKAISNLNTVQANMRDQAPWAATAQFKQANRELDEVLAKMQQIKFSSTGPSSSLFGPNAPQGSMNGGLNQAGASKWGSNLGATSNQAQNLAQTAPGAAQGLSQMQNAAQGTQRATLLLNRALRVFTTAYLGSSAIRQLTEWSDAAMTMNNRVMLVSQSQEEANATMRDLQEIARRTRSPMEGIVSVYQKVMMASKELGATQQEALSFVETVGMALAIQGGSANTARGALLQLSQAVGTDVVRAEEFNSILEGAYPLAILAAKGIDEAGGSVARLRRLVIDGKITSEQFFRAIINGQKDAESMFARTAPTISQATQVFNDNIIAWIQNSEQAKTALSLLAGLIITVADNIGPLVDVITALGIAWGVGFAASKVGLILAAASNVGLLATAFNGLKVAMMFLGGPIAGAIGLTVAAIYLLSGRSETAAERIRALDEAMVGSQNSLERYASLVGAAKDEQEKLGGVLTLTTQRMLMQSRAQLQSSLTDLQGEIKKTKEAVFDDGWVQNSRIDQALNALYLAPSNEFFGNETVKNLHSMLKAIKDGSGDIGAFAAEMNRLKGIGTEVDSVLEDMGYALEQFGARGGDNQAVAWMGQAEEAMTSLAKAIGGFDQQLATLSNVDTPFEKLAALHNLMNSLKQDQMAGQVIRGGGAFGDASAFTDLADLLEKLAKARELELNLREALGANASSLQSLVEQSRKMVEPLQDGAAATTDINVEAQKISFNPAVSGATQMANELERGQRAIEGMRNGAGSITLPSMPQGPQVIEASYRPQAASPQISKENEIMAFLQGSGIKTAATPEGSMAFAASNTQTKALQSQASVDLVGGVDRQGQSEEYVSVLKTINEELDDQYANMSLNTEAMKTQQIVSEATNRARQEGVILSQQDIALIAQKAEALSQIQTKIEMLDEVSETVFGNMGSALDNYVRTGKLSFSDLASSIIADLAKIGAQSMILAPLKSIFGSALGGLMGIPSNMLPGFNEGADFTVGGSGGVDKNVVAFRASRGERVTVTPAGEDGSRRQNVTVNFNITTPNVESFRQSEAQLAARAQRMIAQGARNN